jgi:DNA polymerase-1
VVTSDRDSFQLASETVTILMPRRGVSELERIGPAEVRERYGVEPWQVPDFIALRGDPSDRLPGASGVGPQKAAAVLREHGSLEAALAAGRFSTEAEELRIYLAIARLQADAPLPPLPDVEPSWTGAAALAGVWGLRGLADRLRSRA